MGVKAEGGGPGVSGVSFPRRLSVGRASMDAGRAMFAPGGPGFTAIATREVEMEIRFQGIAKHYDGSQVLTGVDLVLASGSFNVLQGKNGSGKTTLLEIVAGTLEPSAGELFFGPTRVNGMPPFERKAFYVPQTLHKYWHLLDERLFCFIPNRTVRENVLAAKAVSGNMEDIERLLEQFGLAHVRCETPDHLSYGLQQRLALARAFLTAPNIILLDEPMSAVDRRQKPRLIELLKTAHRTYRNTILYVTHDADEAAMFHATHYVIEDGRVRRAGMGGRLRALHRPLEAARTRLGLFGGSNGRRRNGRTQSVSGAVTSSDDPWACRRYTMAAAGEPVPPPRLRTDPKNGPREAAAQAGVSAEQSTGGSARSGAVASGAVAQPRPSSGTPTGRPRASFIQLDESTWNLNGPSKLTTPRENDPTARARTPVGERSHPAKQPLHKVQERSEPDTTAAPERRSILPRYLAWQLTRRCNARCIHCHLGAGPDVDRATELTTEEALDLLGQLAKLDLSILSFTGGEPMLRDDWWRIAEAAANHGIPFNVATNGVAVDRAAADRLEELGVHSVTVGMDSHLPEVHDRVRQTDGLFWQAVQAVSRLAERGVRTVIEVVPTRLNHGDMASLVQLAHRIGAAAVHLSPYVPEGRGSRVLELDPDQQLAVLNEWIELRQAYDHRVEVTWHDCRASLLLRDDRRGTYHGCMAGREAGAILANGTVSPCERLPVGVGSVRDSSFVEVWSGAPLLAGFRTPRGHLDGTCATCEYLERCRGCRAVAHAVHGDPLAGDPGCWVRRREANVVLEAPAEGAHLAF